MEIADRIAVMNQGRIEQTGTPIELYERPANEFTARFMGEINIVAVGSPLAALLQGPPNRKIAFRPEAAQLADNGIAAIVKRATYLGSKTELVVETTTGNALKLWTRDKVSSGTFIHFQVATESLILL